MSQDMIPTILNPSILTQSLKNIIIFMPLILFNMIETIVPRTTIETIDMDCLRHWPVYYLSAAFTDKHDSLKLKVKVFIK